MEEESFKTMQQEAIKRVQEMQRRSQSYVTGEPSQKEKQEIPPPKTDQPQIDIFGQKIDEEKALILFLLYILHQNQTSPRLLLAIASLLL